MLKEKLKDFNIILASGSPRRHHFFNELGIDYTIDVRAVDEIFPQTLQGAEITDYLARLKASAFNDLKPNDLLITADTIVWKSGRAINKPEDRQHAIGMLQELSGNRHEVFTSVGFTGKDFQIVVNDRTSVWFRDLSLEEIEFYLDTCQPFDKAGSYGIQDWLGYIGIERLEGCFFNVMGLPTRLVYKTLIEIASD